MKPEDIINQIKEKAQEFAKTHATESAKNYYLLGKRDAAVSFLSMAQGGAQEAIEEVARQVILHEPENKQALWVLESEEWKRQWK